MVQGWLGSWLSRIADSQKSVSVAPGFIRKSRRCKKPELEIFKCKLCSSVQLTPGKVIPPLRYPLRSIPTLTRPLTCIQLSDPGFKKILDSIFRIHIRPSADCRLRVGRRRPTSAEGWLTSADVGREKQKGTVESQLAVSDIGKPSHIKRM